MKPESRFRAAWIDCATAASDMKSPSDADGASDWGSEPVDPVEALVALCIERFDEEGERAIDSVCRAHPEHAGTIRRRLEVLRRAGLQAQDGARDDDADLPRAFGRYRILRRLGHGGMGVVYLAFDAERGRQVALKAGVGLFDNPRARARFEREVRIAAGLQHPRLVPIFDVGEQNGIPYFTMQYVEGATLSRVVSVIKKLGLAYDELTSAHVQSVALEEVEPHARSHSESQPASTAKLSGAKLDDAWGKTYVETVCRIVLDVADALAHAHQAGVVHRDVKPSNILVARDGRAQLFDLGLAHLDAEPGLTATGDFAGTPHYVSPEQIAGRRGGIDKRTDVYSLGVTLYELLTLRVPFAGRTQQAILRQILVKEPPLLRRHNPLVPRDLETICLTAMEKDPSRRYQSAEEMADDLRRFLAFAPVEARPVGKLRRGVRFLRRNPALGAALALALLLAVGVPAGLLAANALIKEQRDKARASADEARFEAGRTQQVAEFLVELFRSSGAHDDRGAQRRWGETITAGEILDRGLDRIEPGLSGQPLVQASLMEAIGRAYQNLGLYDRALPPLNKALALRQNELGEAHAEVARSLHSLATIHLALDDDSASERLCRRSLEIFRRSGMESSAQAAPCSVTLAKLAARRKDHDAAEEHLLRALAIQREALGPRDRSVAATLHALAEVELARGDTARAESVLQEELAVQNHLADPAPADIAANLSALARVYRARGDERGAEVKFAEALSIYRRICGDVHPLVRATLEDLLQQALTPAAAPGARVSPPFAGDEAAFGNRLALLAENQIADGDADLGRRSYEAALAYLERALGARAPEVGACHAGLAALCARGDECERAAFHARTAREILRAAAPATQERLADAMDAVSACLARGGREAEAAELVVESAALRRAAKVQSASDSRAFAGAPESERLEVEFQAGIVALQSGRYEASIQSFERCLELEPRHAVSAYNIACAYALLDRVEPGLMWLERAVDLGFGYRPNAITNAGKDSDLRRLRDDPRFTRIVDRMAAMSAAAEAYASRAAVYLPAGIRRERWPVLIVLHENGSTKDAVVAGPWRSVADALGVALVAPSGPTPTAGDPARGMSWFADLAERAERPWSYEKSVGDALSAFAAEHAIDREHVLLAGDGSGAVVAFDVAVRAPGQYQGVLLNNALLPHEVSESLVQGALSLGLALRVDVDPRLPVAGLDRGADLGGALDELEGRLKAWGLADGVARWTASSGAGADERLIRGVQALTRLERASPR